MVGFGRLSQLPFVIPLLLQALNLFLKHLDANGFRRVVFLNLLPIQKALLPLTLVQEN